ncbi:hypothetical protein BGZ75_001460 [Mortierella antarctica]|nr:hypothetical protein BGZ75_001460 [Mortierella antarctica]
MSGLRNFALIQFEKPFVLKTNKIIFEGGMVGFEKFTVLSHDGLNVVHHDELGLTPKSEGLVRNFVDAVKGSNKLVILSTPSDIKEFLPYFTNVASYTFPNLTDSSYTNLAADALKSLAKYAENGSVELAWALYDDNIPQEESEE